MLQENVPIGILTVGRVHDLQLQKRRLWTTWSCDTCVCDCVYIAIGGVNVRVAMHDMDYSVQHARVRPLSSAAEQCQSVASL